MILADPVVRVIEHQYVNGILPEIHKKTDSQSVYMNDGRTVEQAIGSGSASSLPRGGSIGQVLAKTSDRDYETNWITVSGGGSTPPSGGWTRSSLSADVQSALAKADTIDPSGSTTIGSDLTTKFASEIATVGGEWKWIQARTKSGNYSGLKVNDYIPFVFEGNNYRAIIIGIDTYTGYGQTVVPHHIDFAVNEALYNQTCSYNLSLYNNGLSTNHSPFVASNVYAYLNGLNVRVASSTGANPTTTPVNYTASGILPRMPQAIKDVIVKKHVLVPTRYSSGILLDEDSNYEWMDIGPLWLPFEKEITGSSVFASRNGYADAGFTQYSAFTTISARIKHNGPSGDRSPIWTASVAGRGVNTNSCYIAAEGFINHQPSNSAYFLCPCWRVA